MDGKVYEFADKKYKGGSYPHYYSFTLYREKEGEGHHCYAYRHQFKSDKAELNYGVLDEHGFPLKWFEKQ